MDFKTDLAQQLEAFGLTVTDKQLEQFNTFYEMLIETNRVMNLTAITDPHEVAVKHIVDSLSAYDPTYMPEGARIIDVGTGAGFPGIPLAIYNTSLQVTLFDSLQKRLHFLEQVAAALGLSNVTTLHGRAEDLGRQAGYREQYDVATSRAVARLPILLEWTLPFVKPGGHLIALKGAAYEEECVESGHALSVLGGSIAEVRPVSLPTLDDKRALVCVKKTKPTPKAYPRKPKEIKEKPL